MSGVVADLARLKEFQSAFLAVKYISARGKILHRIDNEVEIIDWRIVRRVNIGYDSARRPIQNGRKFGKTDWLARELPRGPAPLNHLFESRRRNLIMSKWPKRNQTIA